MAIWTPAVWNNLTETAEGLNNLLLGTDLIYIRSDIFNCLIFERNTFTNLTEVMFTRCTAWQDKRWTNGTNTNETFSHFCSYIHHSVIHISTIFILNINLYIKLYPTIICLGPMYLLKKYVHEFRQLPFKTSIHASTILHTFLLGYSQSVRQQPWDSAGGCDQATQRNTVMTRHARSIECTSVLPGPGVPSDSRWTQVQALLRPQHHTHCMAGTVTSHEVYLYLLIQN